ncbi:MAG: PIG-L family deacetylase [Chloroflexota bacterium]|nr:PIG-L family deacetylase [Chloroflexota bacterium]
MTESIVESSTPRRVLVIQAHPDDVEFSSAGTVAKWANQGAEITYCSITSGDKGSDDPEMTGERLAASREIEQQAACDVLGVKELKFLRYKDATLVADLDLRLALTRVIRQVRPDIVMTFDPSMRYAGQEYINHPDHVATGEASLAAVFPSVRDRMTFPELLAEGLEPHKVSEVYLYATQNPDIWIDITDTIEVKLLALKAHASQVRDWDPSDMIRDWARESAAANPNKDESTDEYAESFKYFKLG